MESLYNSIHRSTRTSTSCLSYGCIDIPLINNGVATIQAGIDSTWPKRKISFTEVLANLLRRIKMVNMVTRPDDDNNKYFCNRLKDLTELDGSNDRVKIQEREDLLPY